MARAFEQPARSVNMLQIIWRPLFTSKHGRIALCQVDQRSPMLPFPSGRLAVLPEREFDILAVAGRVENMCQVIQAVQRLA